MARVTPQEFVEKWTRRAQAASQDYVAGVSKVTQSPGAQAAAKKGDYVARVQESADKWARNVGAVSVEDWKRAATEKGGARYGAGVVAAQPKMAAKAAALLQAVDTAAAAVRQMPKGSLEQRINRSVEFQRRMANARIG